MADGKARDAKFAGHFANIQRLTKDGKLVLAGPFSDDPEHWRGLFLFAVPDVGRGKGVREDFRASGIISPLWAAEGHTRPADPARSKAFVTPTGP